MKRCIEDGVGSYGQLQHLFVIGFMPLQLFDINRMEIHGILLDLMLNYGCYGGYGGSCLIS